MRWYKLLSIQVYVALGRTAAAQLAGKAARTVLQSAKQLEAAMVSSSSSSSGGDSSGETQVLYEDLCHLCYLMMLGLCPP